MFPGLEQDYPTRSDELVETGDFECLQDFVEGGYFRLGIDRPFDQVLELKINPDLELPVPVDKQVVSHLDDFETTTLVHYMPIWSV